MASFRIHNDNENNLNVMRGKTREPTAVQKRTVLGLVNANTEVTKNTKNGLQLDKVTLKSKQAVLKTTLVEKTKLIPKTSTVLPKPKVVCQPFQFFEDELTAKPTALLKAENKPRVLRERKITETDTCVSEVLPQCIAPVVPADAVEPMSPAEIAASPMCVDVWLKSEGKKDIETSLRESDYLNLTERLYMCEEYRDEISLYLRALQLEHRPRRNYMQRQPDITYTMRAVLVDWLVEVVEEYKMTNETLYLAVSYIDRFLSNMSVVRSKLQLVGTAAMFIAAKYEEIYPPDVKDFVYITDDTYTKKQVLRMEHLILRILKFDLSVPTAINFLADFTSNYPTPDNVKYLAMYLCELSLLQGDPFLGFLPSEIASAALCVARNSLLPEEEIMPAALHKLLDVQLTDIIHVIIALENTYRAAEGSVQQATRDKFKTVKYLNVASLPVPHVDCSSLVSASPSSSTHERS